MARLLHNMRRRSPFQIIILGYAFVIFVGALFLMLPISSESGNVTPFNEALFTSTSAVCVTGLVLEDTASYWSMFGQAIILLMIQIGGLGVIIVASSFALLSGRKISLMQRRTIQEAISAPKVGGIVRLTGFIFKTTLIFETIGALVMLPFFIKEYKLKGIWMAIFHSVSAFCNAGFDVMGSKDNPFVSLTSFAGHPVINITIMSLIVIGGIGFLTWDDVRVNKHHFHRYRMQSKIILVMTAILIVLPFVYFFFGEFTQFPLKERFFASLFQSVTPRTAGFNTVDFNLISEAGQAIIIVLMLIGGSPGSTAGGMKTTTVALFFSNAVSVFRKKEEPRFFGRRVDLSTVQNASTISLMYLTLFIGGGLIISIAEDLPILPCLFETASAIGTVGLSLGVTGEIGILSQCVLIILMFFGRVGGLTLIYAVLSGMKATYSKLPKEKLTVG